MSMDRFNRSRVKKPLTPIEKVKRFISDNMIWFGIVMMAFGFAVNAYTELMSVLTYPTFNKTAAFWAYIRSTPYTGAWSTLGFICVIVGYIIIKESN